MNDKAQDSMARQKEPERALEFLKLAEEFLKKIEKSKKTKKNVGRAMMTDESANSSLNLSRAH